MKTTTENVAEKRQNSSGRMGKAYDYTELIRCIFLKYGSLKAFAKDLGSTERTLKRKLDGQSSFYLDEIYKTVALLNDYLTSVNDAFFKILKPGETFDLDAAIAAGKAGKNELALFNVMSLFLKLSPDNQERIIVAMKEALTRSTA